MSSYQRQSGYTTNEHTGPMKISNIFEANSVSTKDKQNITSNDAKQTIKQFKLLKNKDELSEITYQIPIAHKIVDAYPCTPLQEGLVALSMKSDGMFIPQIICRLSADIDILRFKAAWQNCVNINSTLRTVFAQTKAGLLQVVLEPRKIEWHTSLNLKEYLTRDREVIPDFGSELLRYAIIADLDSGTKHFVWTFHHAVIDGWAMKLLLEQVDQHYKDGTCNTLVDFSLFIEYLTRNENVTLKASEQFWTQHLAHTISRKFPSLPADATCGTSNADASTSRTIEIPTSLKAIATSSTIIQAAWAILVARYTNASEATYGMVLAGRNFDLPGLKKINGPTFTTVPMRVVLDDKQTVRELFAKIYQARKEMKPYQNVGLQNIRRFGPDAAQACSFENLLVIQPKQVKNPQSLFGDRSNSSDHWTRLNAYALMMQCDLINEGFVSNANYDSTRLTSEDVGLILQSLEDIIMQFASGLDAPVGDLHLYQPAAETEEAAALIIETGVEELESCVHDIIVEKSLSILSKMAIVSWDGEMTYKELHEASDRLAHRLRVSGIGPEKMVVLMFERSLWFVVAMMAILKSGGAFVSLDATQPDIRLRGLIEQTNTSLVLCSEKFADKCPNISAERIIVSSNTLKIFPVIAGRPCSTVEPHNACYVIFTSGSTGNPKGCLIEHSACATTSRSLAKSFGMSTSTRMLQVSSYTFDGCILEILVTLTAGGTIFIPSEDEKMNDITAAIIRTQVNTAWMCTSFARLVNPALVPLLKTLIIGGEKLVPDDLKRWSGKLTLYQAYGPTEACVICIVNEIKSSGTNPALLGEPIHGSYLIVDEALQPVKPGTEGELLIGGPHLARQYVNDPLKTASSFVTTPRWIQKHEPKFQRWYRTGDLVRWDIAAAGFEYVGRKDTQVKINGQRVEMSEIEVHLRRLLPDGADVGIIVACHGNGKPLLAAFICQGKSINDDLFQEYCSKKLVCQDPLQSSIVSNIQDKLHERLPSYMVPKAYIPVRYMPLTTSGKLDRKMLESIAGELTSSDLANYSGHITEYSRPSTENEIRLQLIWANTLKIDPLAIGKYDNFIRLGGDSILAMKLVALGREEGIKLSVANIFKHPTLADLARTIHVSKVDSQSRIHFTPAFSLIACREKVSSMLRDATRYCTDSEAIIDMYPCTPFQEGIMALSITNPGTLIAQHVFQLPEELANDLSGFRAAWNTVVASTPILRTKIVQTKSGGMIQLISEREINWRSHDNLALFLRMDKSIPFGFGAILNRYAIVTSSINGRSATYFVWTLHHACYDGWSMQLTLQAVERQYRRKGASEDDKENNGIAFNNFVQVVQEIDTNKAELFWKGELGHGEPATYPTIAPEYRPCPSKTLEGNFEVKRKNDSGLRLSSLIRAAWAMTTATYANTEDVVFGATLSGRSGASMDMANVIGPTATTIPVRARIDPQMTALDFLRTIEANEIEAMAFEQFGLPRIRLIDEKVKAACDFQNLLVIQASDKANIDNSFLGPRLRDFINADVYDTYALTMECAIANNSIRTNAIFDPVVIPEIQMQRIVRYFEHILLQLCNEEISKTLFEITTISPSDACEIQQWNANLPPPMDACVHHALEKVMLQNPAAEAICSWDGNLTRGELESVVSRLAQALIQQGIGIGSKVPILFNKSKWAVIAILAIIKSGAAFVPLDPRDPVQRLVSIIEQINGTAILCSAELDSLCSTSFHGINTIVVSERTVALLPDEAVPFFQEFSPQNDLYIIFTSGSTGHPKGTIIQHRAYCAGSRDHGKALCFDESSRFLQFASYSFDTSVEDILTTLMTGGCLCIPSEEERSSDIVGAIKRMNVNTADLTPSFINSISPDDVPSLRRLTLGGEPLTSKAIEVWADRVHLINGYGTTECCVTSLVNANITRQTNPANIGCAVGAVSWIVDVADSSRILPIGAVGELLIEGPAIASGYLNDPERTARCFVDRLILNNPHVRDLSRHYKTGDLVQYNHDGSINFISRKDNRVKLYGQRIELGDIECHLLDSPEVRNIVVVLPNGGAYQDKVTALVELERLSYTGKKQEIKTVSNQELEGTGFNWSIVVEHLRNRVPSYMIPSCWIAVERMPLHTSGKLDRTRICGWLHGLSKRHPMLAEAESGNTKLIPPGDTISMDISKCIAEILADEKHGRHVVGYDLKLADIGIDSIKLMSLVAGIKRLFGSNVVPLSLLMNHATKISDIARHIETSKEEKPMIWNFSVDLLEEFQRLDTQLEAIQCPIGVVFLTGATGYLGTQILRQLLAHPGVDRVIAHVRARNSEDALGRLEAAAQSAAWTISTFTSKLEVWNGDLSKAMLGLDPEQWSRLGDIDAIIHNGASVNWTSSYHALKAANVHSTVEILKVVHASRSKMKLIFLTGGRSFAENEDLESSFTKLSILDGYSQTKFLSEALVKSFAQREAFTGRSPHIKIVVPGLIIGTAGEGIPNSQDFVWRYVAGALSIGVYPVPDEDDWLEISSSDRVAKATIASLIHPPGPDVKVIIDDGIGMPDFWRAVTAHAGRELRPVSSQEWKKQIQVDIETEREAHPLWPVAHLLEDGGNLGKGRTNTKSQRADGEHMMAVIGKNTDFLVRTGFFDAKKL